MKTRLIPATIAALLAMVALAATAQTSADHPSPPAAERHADPAPSHGGQFQGPHGPMQPPGPMGNGPAEAVIHDLEQLRHLYLFSGRKDDLEGIYRNVLTSTHDPMVRHYVRDALVQLQLEPANPATAIATLRASLKEDLADSNARPRQPPLPPRAGDQQRHN